MIFTERTIRIVNGLCEIDNPIILYRGDFNVEIRFTIINCPYKYTAKDASNVIETANASYGQLVIKSPNDDKVIFSDVAATNEGAIVFTIKGEMIDEEIELGDYDFQIRLFDSEKASRATIPPVVGGVKIEEPISVEIGHSISETNEINVASATYAKTTAAAPQDAFDEDGNYNKTIWEDKMLISDARLNKMEDGIAAANQKVNSIPTKTSQLTNDSDFATNASVDEKIANAKIDSSQIDLTSYAKKADLPTRVSQLTNDANYTTKAYVDSAIEDIEITGGTGVAGVVSVSYDRVNEELTYMEGNIEAGEISITDTANNFTSTDVEGALAEVSSQVKNITGSGGSTSSSASNVTITDTVDNFSSTNVEDALAELMAKIEYLENKHSAAITYEITNNLTNVTNSNSATYITSNSSYSATLTPKSGYNITTVRVLMAGSDITSSSYSNGSIYIGDVIGDIAITATAAAPQTSPDLTVSSVSGGTYNTAQAAKVVYTTSKSIAKHEFSNNPVNGTHYYTDVSKATGDGVSVSTVEGQGSKYTLTFNPGVLSTGTKNGSLRLTDDDGNVITSNYTLTITEQDTTTLSINSITGGTFEVTDNATVKYTTSVPVVKHEFNLHTEYGESFTDGTDRVTSSGNNYTMTFNAGELTEGTKYGAIRVTDASGNVVTKTFTLVIEGTSNNIVTLAITSITGGTYTTSQQAKITYTTNMAITKHEFNLHNDTTPDAFSDGNSRVTSNGNTHTMTFNAGELTAGTKNACIRVTSVDGSVVKATVTLTITGTTSNDYVVCSCKGTKYSTIVNAIRNGATTLALVKSQTGAGTGCGRCVGTIQNIIDEVTKESGGGIPTTPTLSVTSISGGTFKTTQQAKIVYTTNKAVTKHEFNNHYTSGSTTGFSDGTSRVTSSGTTYTMTFNAGELSAGTKNGAIRLTDANGNTVVKTYTLIINTDSTTTPSPDPTPTPTPSDPSSTALKDWDAFNNTYGNYVCYSPTQVAVSGKRIRMTAIKKTTTAVPKGGTGTPTTKNYLSGAMVSKKAFKYGTFTFKFKLSANNTYLWPMIWTLPDNNSVKAPELDLLESWGSFTGNSVIQTLHVYQNGTFKANAKQANTPVDLTKEHTLKIVWATNNTITMYVDGVAKLTYGPAHMTNPNTGEIDYQVWFLNLGLGTYSGGAPNGVGWFEITDYSFEPVYTRTRQKQHYWSGNFTDGTLPSGKF